MSQIRFNIGVPRGGSAARLAEDRSECSIRSMRPQAGSAARSAEERKRSESSAGPRAFSIGLRAEAARPTMPASSAARPDVAAEDLAASQKASATVSRQSAGPASSAYVHAGSLPAIAPLSAEQREEAVASSRPPERAVSRIQSLVQSLFSSGSGSGKS